MANEASADRANRRLAAVGVFDDARRAERTLDELKSAGFAPEQISVVAKHGAEVAANGAEANLNAPVEGAGNGAFLGGITGGVFGWLLGIGALTIPGIGPIVAAGALATTLGGAAIGAVAGGLIGALVDLGIPEEEARGYQESVRGGGILLTVHPRDERQARDARDLLERQGGADVRVYGLDAGDTVVSSGPNIGQAGAAAGATVAASTTDHPRSRTNQADLEREPDRSGDADVAADQFRDPTRREAHPPS